MKCKTFFYFVQHKNDNGYLCYKKIYDTHKYSNLYFNLESVKSKLIYNKWFFYTTATLLHLFTIVYRTKCMVFSITSKLPVVRARMSVELILQKREPHLNQSNVQIFGNYHFIFTIHLHECKFI